MRNVREILADWLIANGYDGLAGDDCGCPLDQLICCDEDPSQCVPGYKVECTPEKAAECDWSCWCHEGESCISSTKPGEQGSDE